MPSPTATALDAQGCGFAALLVAAPVNDGKFLAPMEPQGQQLQDVSAFIAVGRDAASQSRPRDAETAYISACRIAAQLAGAQSPQIADAKYELANLYLNALPSGGAVRAAVLKRSQQLFSESVTLYGAKRGLGDEKTRLAAAGLASSQAIDPAPETAVASDVVEVPRVLLAERNTLELPTFMTTAMGAGPAKKKPTLSEPEAVAEESVQPPPVKSEPVRSEPVRSEPVRSEPVGQAAAPQAPPTPDALKLDLAPKSWNHPAARTEARSEPRTEARSEPRVEAPSESSGSAGSVDAATSSYQSP
jgi:hypothetical protein